MADIKKWVKVTYFEENLHYTQNGVNGKWVKCQNWESIGTGSLLLVLSIDLQFLLQNSSLM